MKFIDENLGERGVKGRKYLISGSRCEKHGWVTCVLGDV